MRLATLPDSGNSVTPGNENFEALEAAALFGIKRSTSVGLFIGLYGGVLYTDAVPAIIGDSQTALAASVTNYVERTRTGTVSVNSTGWTALKIPLGTAVTNTLGITAWQDYRGLGERFQHSRVAVAVTSGDVTLTQQQARVDELKTTGVLTGNRSVIVPAMPWCWIVDNANTGAFTTTVKTAAGSGVTVTQGTAEIVYCDGTDVKRALSGLTLAALTLTGTLTLSGAAANIALGANFVSYDGTDAGFSLDASNNATLSANLVVSGTSGINLNNAAGSISIANNSGGSNAIILSSTVAGVGISIGGDVNLYRSSANTLATDDSLAVSGSLTVSGANGLTLSATASPTGTGTGAVGQIAWDTAYLYICTATNDWRRIALVDF